MILTNTENFTTPSKFDGGVLSKESDNKGMWKQVLEKNGLYEALHKFETIRFYKQNQVLLSADKQRFTNKDHDNSLDNTTKSNNLGKYCLNREAYSNVDSNLEFVPNRPQKDLNLVQQAFLNQSVNRLSVLPKSSEAANLTKDFLRDIKWTNKNVMITNANSSLEIWIRDGNLADNKLKDILKNIRHSMAELGASLSKVSINGKVIFQNKE